jgi:tetratricopeptide (TPR) repeat protein
MTVGQVQDYIKRGRQAQDLDIFERVSDGLHIPGRMLGIGRRPWERQNAGTAPTESSDSHPTLLRAPESDRGVAPSQESAGEPDAGEDADIMLMVQEADRTDIGPGTIEGLYAVFDKLCRDYPSVPAVELQRKVKKLYRRLMSLRQGRMTFGQHKELLALSGWATALLACVDWDLNQREAAETARAASLRFAKEIEHGELTTWSFEMQAWFALTEGRYSDVTSIAKAAQTLGGENSAIVQLILQEARGWSRLGNKKAAESAMERGYDLLQRLPAIHYPRHFIYDRTKFPFYVASCHQWLGNYERAEELAHQVIGECKTNGTAERSPMRLADVNITLGLVYAHRGELDAALQSGFDALGYERKSGPSLLIRAAELNNAIIKNFPKVSRASKFDEKLKNLFGEFGMQAPNG